MNSQFHETQKFTQWWIWLMLGMVALIPLWGIVQQIILGHPLGDNPMSDLGLVLFAVFTFAFIAFFRSIALITEISPEGISMKFFPFMQKQVSWEDVEQARIVHYRALSHGIGIGGSYGTMYNIQGNTGLAIELKDGHKLLIGTQQEEEMESVLKQLGKI